MQTWAAQGKDLLKSHPLLSEILFLIHKSIAVFAEKSQAGKKKNETVSLLVLETTGALLDL